MKLSSVDIGNPIYSKSVEPRYQMEKYTDTFQDDEGNEFIMSVICEYYEYSGERHVAKLTYDPKPVYYMTDSSMQESVKESVTLMIGPYILDCTPEKYEPKYPLV